jgi:Tfp pilus assembly protein PilF
MTGYEECRRVPHAGRWAGAAFALIAGCLLFLAASCSHGQVYYIERGNELVKKGDYTNALGEFQMAAQVGEANHRLYRAIAEVQAHLGETDAAIDSYLQAAKLLERDGETIARQIRDSMNIDEQQRLAHIVEDRINPYLSETYLQIGMLCVEKEDDASAVISVEQSLAYVENNLRARMELAALMELKGDTDRALQEWKRFVKDMADASVEEKAFYAVGPSEVETAREHIYQLMLARGGLPPGGPQNE